MPGRSAAWIVILLGAAMVWGLAEIILTPLETGDAYPPYSTLRSDPLGAKALYESLAVQPGIQVERLYKDRQSIQDPQAAIVVLGVDPNSWLALDEKKLQEYEDLVKDGGRLVIAFLPVSVRAPREKLAIESRWNVHIKYASSGLSRPEIERAPQIGLEPRTDPTTGSDSGWEVLATTRVLVEADAERHLLADFPVAIERGFGKGSIVLNSASFALSNQGLREAPDAELIAMLVGPARRIWFDETHFGIKDSGSVTTLMRKYRLEGAVAVLLLVAGLFLWSSSSSLLPPRVAQVSTAVGGRDSLDALASLLRRGIPAKDLTAACRVEYMKSAARERGAERIEAELRLMESQGPLEAYRAAQHLRMERK
jgi:hypothetical protein